MVDVEEYAERLADIGAGPWTERAVISRGYLQPQTNLDSLAFREDEIDLDGLREVLQERDLAREDDGEATAAGADIDDRGGRTKAADPNRLFDDELALGPR